jgi:hypothetical protein
MMLQIVVVSDADLEAMDMILNTFVVDEAALAALGGADLSETTTSYGTFEFFDLVDGDCFDPAVPIEEVYFESEVEWVDCAGPHEAEVYAWTVIPDADAAYPGEETVVEISDNFCRAEFEPYVGSVYEESFLDYWYFYPTESGWVDYPFVMCVVRDPAGEPLVGTALQSGW